MQQEVYNRIKVVLVERGITNKRLAEAIHVTAGTVSTWCTNDRQPSIKQLHEIANFLECDVRELMAPNTDSPKKDVKF